MARTLLDGTMEADEHTLLHPYPIPPPARQHSDEHADTRQQSGRGGPAWRPCMFCAMRGESRHHCICQQYSEVGNPSLRGGHLDSSVNGEWGDRDEGRAWGKGDTQVYGRRWYVLLVFSLLAMLQSTEWNFYSPISGVVERIYGWDDYLVEWMANTAGLVYTVVVCFASMLVDAKGARFVVLVAGFCCLV